MTPLAASIALVAGVLVLVALATEVTTGHRGAFSSQYTPLSVMQPGAALACCMLNQSR